MPTASIDGRDLHYETRGSGPALLLIQGLSGTHLAWGEPFLDALGDDMLLITYDHRGIGLSGGDGAPFSIADLARDAASLLAHLEIEQAHVMGISMGGMVAQELALGHPRLLRTLTLGCTYAGGPGSRITDQAIVQRLATSALSGDAELALRTGWEVNVSAAFAAQTGTFDAFRAMAGALPAPVPVLLQQAQAATMHDTSARLASITAPTLVIHGDEDQMLDVANGRLIASLIPGARLEILERCGHMFWWERPEQAAALVREHLAAAAPA
jgi:pimeloyl-ACP methyl ester carboxylesterase